MAPRQTILSFPTLESSDAAGFAPPPDAQDAQPGGSNHALQNDHPGVDPGSAGTLRAASIQQAAVAGDGSLRPRPENQPRGVESPARPGESGERSEPDSQRRP